MNNRISIPRPVINLLSDNVSRKFRNFVIDRDKRLLNCAYPGQHFSYILSLHKLKNKYIFSIAVRRYNVKYSTDVFYGQNLICNLLRNPFTKNRFMLKYEQNIMEDLKRIQTERAQQALIKLYNYLFWE